MTFPKGTLFTRILGMGAFWFSHPQRYCGGIGSATESWKQRSPCYVELFTGQELASHVASRDLLNHERVWLLSLRFFAALDHQRAVYPESTLATDVISVRGCLVRLAGRVLLFLNKVRATNEFIVFQKPFRGKELVPGLRSPFCFHMQKSIRSGPDVAPC
jgi:hypothetical protein